MGVPQALAAILDASPCPPFVVDLCALSRVRPLSFVGRLLRDRQWLGGFFEVITVAAR